MIGIFNDAGVRLAMTYNGLTINDPNDAFDDTFEVNTISYSTNIDHVSDPHQMKDGLEVGPARKISMLIQISGVIRAATIAKLFDKMTALSVAFDPALISHENPGADFLAYDFTTPADAGNLSCRYYARARTVPTPPVTEYSGTSTPFAIDLLIADPRRYLQAVSTLSGAGTGANAGNYRTWPTLTATMAGAGSATYAITNNPALAGIATTTLTLDLSGRSAAEVVVVDMGNKKITVDGVETPSLYVSGDYFEMEPGNNVISYANTTNATSVLTWYGAFTS